ncbi:class I SAM-dependent methyltransferase [bacterium]|nr:class I SAM-dependent methyltransferase [bacterium]
MTEAKLSDLIDQAISRREDLFNTLHNEKTDTYRIFHGVNEGRPGLTMDRYGSQVLVQSFYETLKEDELLLIKETVNKGLRFEAIIQYNDRSSGKTPESRVTKKTPEQSAENNSACFCDEIGIHYAVRSEYQGQDPLLFLDIRAGRRFVLHTCKGLSVLNLFAYTCGVGTCAAVGGANEIWNVDFSGSVLDVGKQNLKLNGFPEDSAQFIKEDFFPVIRQLAGIPVGGRGKAKKKEYQQFHAREFDLVFLDPPRWAKSPFGTVDLIRDYQSVFKPALLTVTQGGRVICTNHVPKITSLEWLDVLKRCAEKAGRPLKQVDIIEPESDFPSPDGNHPLKIAVIEV